MKGAAQAVQGYKEVYMRPGVDWGVFNSSEAKLGNGARAFREPPLLEMVNSDRPTRLSSTQTPVNPVIEWAEAGYQTLLRDESWP